MMRPLRARNFGQKRRFFIQDKDNNTGRCTTDFTAPCLFYMENPEGSIQGGAQMTAPPAARLLADIDPLAKFLTIKMVAVAAGG
jgi:hypothetical protein